MSLSEGVMLFVLLLFFFWLGYKSGELRGMEYHLAELQEELNDADGVGMDNH